ncbi:related to AMFR [Lecanosticta acicola]|uniref:Coupling of ubiquitin conjugation to ER degradation protein 1 n=1 Tax=Lecanosticta acicola TaxID=111012 RepID=A0AAI8Z711_9PEZI|nr:related to AMFR [Lecanosticta acicola]
MAQEGQTSINIPQIIAVAVVGFLAFRWFMSKPSTLAGGSSSRRNNTIDINKIEQVASVFPQLDRRSIAWDLQRNGGNVEATTERVLGGRGLEVPPPSFQPNIPQAAAPATAQSTATEGRGKATTQQDLITRYGLQARVGGKGKEPVPSDEQKRNTWSADKTSRAAALKKQKEDMILAARRKMAEKEAQL